MPVGNLAKGRQKRGAGGRDMEEDVKTPTKNNDFKDNTAGPSYATSSVGKSVVPTTACPSSPRGVDHWFI